MILQKAKDFATELGIQPYSPVVGWLGRWKKRIGIKFRKAHGEKSSASFEAAEEWMSRRMPVIIENFDPDQIYNADETGLFYRATPDGTLCFEKETLTSDIPNITLQSCLP